MWPLVRQARYLSRYREIAQVLAGHGFGLLVEQLGLRSLVSLPRRLTRRTPIEQLTAPQRLRMALVQLGPTYVKLGQILSTRPDLLPVEWIEELNRLQDAVPPFSIAAAIATIEAELGQPIDALFQSFERQPLAAASLGQVHSAVLPGGAQVVVKVQRPDIAALVASDLAILNDLALLAQERTALGKQYDLVDLAWEFSTALRAELDYRREGRNADRFRANFAGNPRVYIPAIYWQYTSARVLTSERLFGVKINDIPGITAAGLDLKRLARNSTELIMQEVFVDGFFHGDPHPGNFFALAGEVIGAVDFGQVGMLDPQETGQMMLLLQSLVSRDLEGALRSLERLGVIVRSDLPAGLRRDMSRFIETIVDQPLSDLSARETIDMLASIFQRHGLRLPAPLAMLLKAIVMMEGTGLLLDPDLDVFAIARPYAMRAAANALAPRVVLEQAAAEARNVTEATLALPEQAGTVLRRLAAGALRIETSNLETRRVADALSQASTRVALALVLAAQLVALTVLVALVSLGAGGIPLLVALGLGILAAAFTGAWLTLALMRRY